ncbi:hypothetical protein HOI18_03355 [Candidatus Uhrbacteria bacterium]|jgi:hypothetical protein|nr:hypothetical protein [Candidatus Uhrbacteria bacterium]
MKLSDYHQHYVERSDEQIVRRVASKRLEIKEALQQSGFVSKNNPVRVAILGCADKRFVSAYKELFEEALKTDVNLTVFDLTIDHLEGAAGVVQQDITKPLIGGPFDITFAHIVLKFIKPELHLSVFQNAYDVLSDGGLAVFIQGKEELQSDSPEENTYLPETYKYERNDIHPVNLTTIRQYLKENSIKFLEFNQVHKNIEPVDIEAHQLLLMK